MKGKFKPATKFLAFVENTRGRMKSTDITEAILNGKYFSLENLNFIVKIHDDGSIDFIEKDTNHTTESQRKRFIEMIEDKTISPTKIGWVINELEFKSLDGSKRLSLIVEREAPYSKLSDILDEKDVKVKLSKAQKNKISQIFDLFGDDEQDDNDAPIIEDSIIFEEPSSSTDWLKASFDKIKEEKKEELKSRLEQAEIALSEFQMEKIILEKKIKDKETDISLISDRLKSMTDKVSNGMFFYVSDRQNEKVNLDDETKSKLTKELSKVKSINVDAMLKLFEIGEYHITLYDNKNKPVDIKDMSADILKELAKLNLTFKSPVYIYEGEMNWHEIVDYLVNIGFTQLSRKPK